MSQPDEQPGGCAHCGRTDLGSPDAGLGTIGNVRMCSPTVSGRPHCWDLVVRYSHPIPCRCWDRSAIAGPPDVIVQGVTRTGE